MTKTYYIGLDVHKETIAIAYATGGTREDSVYHGPCGGSVLAAERALRKLAEKLGVEFSALKVCYEAGPTGFVLARRLIRYGLDCVLMSPSKTERKPNEKIKTDKRDACKISSRRRGSAPAFPTAHGNDSPSRPMHAPASRTAVRLFHQIRPREPVLVIVENILAAIPTRHHVVNCPSRLVS